MIEMLMFCSFIFLFCVLVLRFLFLLLTGTAFLFFVLFKLIGFQVEKLVKV